MAGRPRRDAAEKLNRLAPRFFAQRYVLCAREEDVPLRRKWLYKGVSGCEVRPCMDCEDGPRSVFSHWKGIPPKTKGPPNGEPFKVELSIQRYSLIETLSIMLCLLTDRNTFDQYGLDRR